MTRSPFPDSVVHGLTHTEGPGPARSWTVSTAKPVSYRVHFTPGVLDPRNPALAHAGRTEPGPPARRLLVVEEQVDLLYGAALRAYCETAGHAAYEVQVLPAHEQLKTMESVYSVVDAMDRFGLDRRREPVVAVGGGVLMDVVGLACSLYRRSTPYIRVPTTLIGLVDAGVGAKTGVNFGGGKNRLGTYHPAVETLLDPAFLATLGRRHIGNGLAEILKIALVKDRDLFDLLESSGARLLECRFQAAGPLRTTAHHVLARAVHGMLEELHDNLWEHRLERVVDYGHSFSPTLEMRALPALLHGEAVNLDMALTTLIAQGRGLMTDRQCARVLNTMRMLRLPVHHPLLEPKLLRDALADTVRHRDGRQRLPLPVGIGDAVFVNDLTEREITCAARKLARLEEVSGHA